MSYQNAGEVPAENETVFSDRSSRTSQLKRVLLVLLGVLAAVVVLVIMQVSGDSLVTSLSKTTPSDSLDIKNSGKTATVISNIIKRFGVPSSKTTVTVRVPTTSPVEDQTTVPEVASASPAPVEETPQVIETPQIVETLEKLAHRAESSKKDLFEEFKTKHSKKYTNNKEELKRYEIFKENLAKIDDLNANSIDAKFVHTSKFADLTAEEFQTRTGLRSDYSVKMNAISELSDEKKSKIGFVDFGDSGIPSKIKQTLAKNLPASFDWRTSGAVTPVKDQQECGGCWAFAATGDMEGTWKLKTGSLVSLSEQELISCAAEADGCSGGMMNEAYQFVIKNGITTEAAYPYTESDGTCVMPDSSPVTISGWTQLKTTKVSDLQAALTTEGPIAVAINANQMQFYSSGIDVCSSQAAVNHAVLLVGYGSSNGQAYWILKNSWGEDWGQEGYYYISTAKGACGVQSMPMTSF